jgi:hypothetical protein
MKIIFFSYTQFVHNFDLRFIQDVFEYPLNALLIANYWNIKKVSIPYLLQFYPYNLREKNFRSIKFKSSDFFVALSMAMGCAPLVSLL